MNKPLVVAVSLSLIAASNGLSQEGFRLKYGPKGNPIATPLSSEHTFLGNSISSPFWRLMPYYVPQNNEYACSAAALSMVVNGILRAQNAGLRDSDKIITQADLLDKVRKENWKERLSKEGYNGKHGLTLDQLESVTREALAVFSLTNCAAEKVSFGKTPERDLTALRDILAASELSGDFLIIHFVQDDLTDAAGGPYAHISPIGAYDSKTKRVLILDVDREWYEPYWVSDEALLKALVHKTEHWGQGGIVRVSRKK
jgi:hypothetical protein